MNENVAVLALAALAAAELLIIVLLITVNAKAARRHALAMDRLLLLGKTSTPGEALMAYERLNRLERAREELLEQRHRLAPAEGAGVARKETPGARWFGVLRRPRRAAPSGG